MATQHASCWVAEAPGVTNRTGAKGRKGDARMPRRSERPPVGPAARPGAQPGAEPGAQRSAERGSQPTTLITVLLALLLLSVGVAGYEAASLLGFAISGAASANATPSGLAALVCDSFKRQDYQQLVTYIDPAPIPPAVTTTFDARQTIAQLQTLDANEGKVTSCAFAPYTGGSVVSTDGATRYQVTLRRAAAVGPIVGALVLRQQSGGPRGWQIERDSFFLVSPIGG